jgi:hypothetical protein
VLSAQGTNDIKYYVADGRIRAYNWIPFSVDALHADLCSNFTVTTENVYEEGFSRKWVNFTFSSN